jgi:hypothetical protein
MTIMGDVSYDLAEATEYREALAAYFAVVATERDDDLQKYLASPEGQRGEMVSRFQTSKAAKKGASVVCPTCQITFTKNHPAQAFCNKEGKHKCKTRYHNSVSDKRRERSLQFMPK